MLTLSYENEFNLHVKEIALRRRLKVIRKWPISEESFQHFAVRSPVSAIHTRVRHHIGDVSFFLYGEHFLTFCSTFFLARPFFFWRDFFLLARNILLARLFPSGATFSSVSNSCIPCYNVFRPSSYSLIFTVLPCIPPYVFSCIPLYLPLYSLALPHIFLCIPMCSLVFRSILLFS